MAEESDQESKTEKATEKRLRDAIEQGNIPVSREVLTLGSMAAMLAVFGLMMAQVVKGLFEVLHLVFEQAGLVRIESAADGGWHLIRLSLDVGYIVAPALCVIAAGGIIAGAAQNGQSAGIERLAPKFNRLSPKANFEQIFGKQALVELVSMTLKLLSAAFVAYWVIQALFADVVRLVLADPLVLLQTMQGNINSIFFSFTLLCVVVAIIDVFFVRMRWNKKLMMTRQEVKDEMKQSEGDPMIKQRMQLLGRRRQSRRMIADVPKATMVIVNPTHYAVAMRYVAAEGGAPRVLAKGKDHIAFKIRQICELHDIPVIENPDLARALHKSVSVGSMIPVEFYRAVAEVVHFVELRRRMRT